MPGSAHFFTDGLAYERLMGRWSRAVGEMFVGWLSLPNGLRWIDVGCGTGAFTELIVDKCAPSDVSAIDPAEDQIAYARNSFIADRVEFTAGDALALSFPDNEFDVAVMALVISFIPEPAKAVSEMRRVVKPGGTVATYMWDGVGKGFVQQPLIEALEAMNVEAPPLIAKKNSRISELQNLFDVSGLVEVSTRTIEIQVTYVDFDEFWSSQTGLATSPVQAIRKLSRADIERLKDYLKERLSVEPDGRIAYPAHANAVKAVVPA